MHISGRIGADRPDPFDDLRRHARTLGIPAAGLVPQRHLEDWGVCGLSSSQHDEDGGRVTTAVTLSRMYGVWRNPDDREDPVNLSDLDDGMRRSLDRPMPDGPPWLVRQLDRLRRPVLWDAVHTHWAAFDRADEELDLADLLTAHVDHVLQNRFRAEHGLGDPTVEPWRPLAHAAAVHGAAVAIDGVVVDGATIDTDAWVVGIGTPLRDGRAMTAVVPRALLDLVTLEFLTDAGDEPVPRG